AAPPGRPAVAALVRSDTGERLPLRRELVTIGRGSDRDLVVDDTRVSRAHASVRRGTGGWAVTDDGSSNGTRVNGRELAAGAPHPLTVGDAIEIGRVTITFEAGPPPASPPARGIDDAERTRISAEVLPPGRPRPGERR
ncbi:MAG: hypothetical protein JWM05_273, partial [Acidimicrobiales bacterium]|nr:hypothetical protein [Acidimicrobiales bacterium]